MIKALPGGGQSETFEVQEFETKQFGVLKLPKNLREVTAARFRREIDILTATQHPSIVQLLDWCGDDGALGYVSPLGTPLDIFWPTHAASRSARERYDCAYSYVRQLAEGLCVLHAKEVVHRDIQPSNIIVLSDGEVPRPVLIDFGLAIRPEDERLTAIDGHPAANQFAAPPAAYYGKEDPSPAWDCLGLGWIFGWLVAAEKPKNFRYHWRFHEMVEEDRSNRVRALIATCSHEKTVPRDAGALLEMMDRFRLGGGPTAPGVTPNFAAAEKAYIEGTARRVIEVADEMERVETCIALLGNELADVRRLLNDGVSANGSFPIRVYDFKQNGVSSDTPIREVMESAQKNVTAQLFACLCGSPPRAFQVFASVDYRSERPDTLPFRLYVRCHGYHGGPLAQLNKHAHFMPRRDGVYCDESGREVDAGDIASLLLGWITSPDHWALAG